MENFMSKYEADEILLNRNQFGTNQTVLLVDNKNKRMALYNGQAVAVSAKEANTRLASQKEIKERIKTLYGLGWEDAMIAGQNGIGYIGAKRWVPKEMLRPELPKDMENLSKILSTWQEQNFKTEDGVNISGSPNSVWIDNWRIATGGYDERWQISYKGTPVIHCVDNTVAYTASDYVLADAHLNIGDVLQMVEEKTGMKCPQIDPKVNVEKHYIPSNFVEQNEEKVRGEKSVKPSQQKKEIKRTRSRGSIER